MTKFFSNSHLSFVANEKQSKMIFTILIGLAIGVATAITLLIVFLPKKVQYIESIRAKAPVSRVYDAIRFQEQLMDWSAWPKETKSACAVQHEDGKVGAQTVYMNKKGKKFGYQEVTELVRNEEVGFYLKSYVAPFEENVRMKFILKELGPRETEVNLWFDETLKKPQFLIAYLGGIIKWVHAMHLKDLANLKQYVESR